MAKIKGMKERRNAERGKRDIDIYKVFQAKNDIPRIRGTHTDTKGCRSKPTGREKFRAGAKSFKLHREKSLPYQRRGTMRGEASRKYLEGISVQKRCKKKVFEISQRQYCDDRT